MGILTNSTGCVAGCSICCEDLACNDKTGVKLCSRCCSGKGTCNGGDFCHCTNDALEMSSGGCVQDGGQCCDTTQQGSRCTESVFRACHFCCSDGCSTGCNSSVFESGVSSVCTCGY